MTLDTSSGARRGGFLWMSLLLALAGAVSAGIMQAAHLDLATEALAAVCGDSETGCGAILSSGWAYFPPLVGAVDVQPADVRGRLPMASIGLAYFLGLATWLAALGGAALTRRRLFAGLYGVVLLGCVGSAGLLAVMFTQLDAFCPFCAASHAANFALLGMLFLARPRDGATASVSSPASSMRAPSLRHLLTAGVLALLVAVAAPVAAQALAAHAERDALALRMEEIEFDASLVELSHLADDTFTRTDEKRARFDAIIRPDDAQRLPSQGTYGTLVVFSDLECPNCHRFELFLRDVVRPMFREHLRIVFKHFPLEHLHDSALPAAHALEAARRQNGFWEMHAVLLERHAELDEVDFVALAAELGLDEDLFQTDMASEFVALRVAEDEELGRSIGVDSTPALFLDRRKVGASVRTLVGFWRMRADALKRVREARGQSW